MIMFDKRLMILCPESKKYIIGNILFQWIELWMNALMIMMLSRIIEMFYNGGRDPDKYLIHGLIIVVTIAVRFFTTRAAVKMGYLASKTVKKKLREKIYEKLLRLGNRYREQASTAELVQASVEGADQLESYFGQYVPQFFYAFIAPITLFVFFGIFGSFKAGLVLFVCVPLIPGSIMMIQKIAKKLLARYWGQYTKLGSTFLENLQGMTTLKIYKADERKSEEMNRESENFRFVTMKVLTMQLNSIIIMDVFTYGGAALGILLAVKEYLADEVLLSGGIFMILLSADFFLPMRRLGSYFHVAMNGLAASDRIFKFLNLPEPPEKKEEIKEDHSMEMKNVSFSYDGKREVLHDVSLIVPEKSFVGIVGESGSGKSTVAKMFMGSLTENSGEVLLGKIPISSINEENLMKNVTYIGHACLLFKGSVRDNLLMGKPNASDDELWDVLRKCEMEEFLKANEGLDTKLTENAGNISGGQRQRIALARALLKDSPIYIFDEATSSVDSESEAVILENVLSLTGKKTIVMITHRLLNIKNADKIYVMENGNPVESGTHDELKKINGVYAGLLKVQSDLERFGGACNE